MSNLTLIIGESGTGKSTSIENLPPEETYIINVIGKKMPFRGFNKNYSPDKKNYICTDDYSKILKTLQGINNNELAKHIKNIVIDDFQYVMANEFMRRASENGWNKFTEIGQHAFAIVDECLKMRDDLFIFILSHSELGDNGKMKIKTIGKMLDEKISLEGMFTTVMHTSIVDGKFKFITQNDGSHIAKSPCGMFEDLHIDNDLLAIKNSMINYYEGENHEVSAKV